MKLLAALGVSLVGAVLAIPASDSFTRADGPLGATWIDQTAVPLQIAFGEVEVSSGSPDYACARWNPATDTFTANQSSQIRLATASPDTVLEAVVRSSGTIAGGTYTAYALSARGIFTGDDTTDIYRTVNNVFSAPILALPAVTWVSGDIVKLEVVGSTLTAYKNGASIGTVVDTAIATGQPGLCSYGIAFGGRIDDWVGDNLGGGTPPATSGKFLLLGVGHP